MKKKPQRKLLVPVDGSDRSLNTVRYIMKIDPFRPWQCGHKAGRKTF